MPPSNTVSLTPWIATAASPKPFGKSPIFVWLRNSSPSSSLKNRWQLASSQITKKSSQNPLPLFAVTPGGSPPGKKSVGRLHASGLVMSSFVEYCGWPDWKTRYHLFCGAKKKTCGAAW